MLCRTNGTTVTVYLVWSILGVLSLSALPGAARRRTKERCRRASCVSAALLTSAGVSVPDPSTGVTFFVPTDTVSPSAASDGPARGRCLSSISQKIRAKHVDGVESHG